ncbi:MAG: hypothetical protein JXO72_15550 [Vicinamibacteria bacterium]|nr:hypothetical protein [Vicinamibacteria bacterium]
MRRLENDLQDSLRRKAPPPDFVTRVRARIERDASLGTVHSRRSVTHWFRMLAAAAALVAAIGVGLVFEQRQRSRARREAALQRTLTALSIAAHHLNRIERKAFSSVRWERIGEQLAGAPLGDSSRPSSEAVHSNGA